MVRLVFTVCRPVEPKPPAPRTVSDSVRRFDRVRRARWRAMTICAMFMPRVMRERLVAEIDQDRLHLAAIVAVDRARRVEHRDAVVEREAGARPHLRLRSLSGRSRSRCRWASRRAAPGASSMSPSMAASRSSRPSLRSHRRAAAGPARAADAECEMFMPLCPSARRRCVPPDACPLPSCPSPASSSSPLAVIRCTVFLSPPMMPVCGLHIVGDDPVAAFARALGLRMGDDVLGLGREADDELRAPRVPARGSRGCRDSRPA